MTRYAINSLIAAVFLFILSVAANAHTGATGIIKERMDRFKESKASMKAIRQSIERGELSKVEVRAQSLVLWADELVEHFPPDSNASPSEALPEIWEEFSEFKALNNQFGEAAAILLKASKIGDVGEARTAFGNVAKACDACHDDYRE